MSGIASRSTLQKVLGMPRDGKLDLALEAIEFRCKLVEQADASRVSLGVDVDVVCLTPGRGPTRPRFIEVWRSPVRSTGADLANANR